MKNTTNAVQHGSKKAHSLNTAPVQLRVGLNQAARLLQGDPLYDAWQLNTRTPYAYDWAAPVPPPDGWPGSLQQWQQLARRIVQALRREVSTDAHPDHVAHVLAHVRTLRRDGLLPDWAAHNPLADDGRAYLPQAQALWDAHGGRVRLVVFTLGSHAPLNSAPEVLRMSEVARQTLRASAGKGLAWGGIEVTQPVQDGDRTRGTGWHVGAVVGESANRSACTYDQPARSVWDVVRWMRYHSQGLDSRLKVPVVPTEGGGVTVHVPADFPQQVAAAVRDGLRARAGLAALGRVEMPRQVFTVNTRRGAKAGASEGGHYGKQLIAPTPTLLYLPPDLVQRSFNTNGFVVPS